MRLQGAVFDGTELLTDGAGAWKSGVEEALTRQYKNRNKKSSA